MTHRKLFHKQSISRNGEAKNPVLATLLYLHSNQCSKSIFLFYYILLINFSFKAGKFLFTEK